MTGKTNLKRQRPPQASKPVIGRWRLHVACSAYAATAAENWLRILPGNRLGDDAFGSAPVPTIAVVMSRQARSQHSERRRHSSGRIHHVRWFFAHNLKDQYSATRYYYQLTAMLNWSRFGKTSNWTISRLCLEMVPLPARRPAAPLTGQTTYYQKYRLQF